MNKLLIIEDDFRVRSQLERGCVEEGFDVTAVGSGREGELLLHNGSYDVVILDWRLPDKSGVEICSDLRREGFTIPVLMLTAMEAVANRVEGLNAGADDYLTKPFAFDELLARVRALQRRAEMSGKKESLLLAYGELQLNPRQHTFAVNNQPVALTKKEFQLAEFFLRHPEEVLSRQEIAHAVWQLYFDTNTNFIDVYVAHLRQKIAQVTAVEYLQSVRGIGYVMRMTES
jgi:two-component system OmpR family response regulator/two-component system response regulator MprA